MTRDHLLGFPALLRQHDEPAAPKEQTVKERPAAFVAFEKGDWAPKMTMGVDLAVDAQNLLAAPVFAPSRKDIVIDPKAETHEITFPDVRDAVFHVLGELGKPATKALLAKFGVETLPDLERKQWADVIATAYRRLAGWIKWSGGEQPVADVVVVEVRYGEGTTDRGAAENWSWKHCGDAAGDIVEYRVVVEAKQADSWIKWNGGECPVAGDTRVEVRLRDGSRSNSDLHAWVWRWGHKGGGGDIVEYRVIK